MEIADREYRGSIEQGIDAYVEVLSCFVLPVISILRYLSSCMCAVMHATPHYQVKPCELILVPFNELQL